MFVSDDDEDNNNDDDVNEFNKEISESLYSRWLIAFSSFLLSKEKMMTIIYILTVMKIKFSKFYFMQIFYNQDKF